MLEWFKRHAWKACIPLKGITSSNLVLSAKKSSPQNVSAGIFYLFSDMQEVSPKAAIIAIVSFFIITV